MSAHTNSPTVEVQHEPPITPISPSVDDTNTEADADGGDD